MSSDTKYPLGPYVDLYFHDPEGSVAVGRHEEIEQSTPAFHAASVSRAVANLGNFLSFVLHHDDAAVRAASVSGIVRLVGDLTRLKHADVDRLLVKCGVEFEEAPSKEEES